jgi:hypothetical protein
MRRYAIAIGARALSEDAPRRLNAAMEVRE